MTADRRRPGIARGAALLFACRVAGALLAYLLLVALARWMGGTELGRYRLAFAWCLVLTNLSVLGLPQAGLRFIGEGIGTGHAGLVRGFVRRSRQLAVGAGSLLALVGIVAVISGAVPQQSRAVFLYAMAAVPVFAFLRMQNGIAHGFSWLSLMSLPHWVLRPMFLLAAAWILWRQDTALTAGKVMATHLMITAALILGQAMFVRRALRPEVADAAPEYRTRQWLRISMPLLLLGTFTAYLPEINMLIAGFVLPDADLAVFDAGMRTAALLAFGLTAVSQATLPRCAQHWAKGEVREVQRATGRAALLMLSGSAAGLLGLVLFGGQILEWFGPEFAVGYRAMLIFATAQLVRSAFGPAGELLGICGQQDRCLLVYGASLLANVVLSLTLTARWGLEGAAVAFLLVVAGSSLWLRAIAVRHLNVDPSAAALLRARE